MKKKLSEVGKIKLNTSFRLSNILWKHLKIGQQLLVGYGIIISFVLILGVIIWFGFSKILNWNNNTEIINSTYQSFLNAHLSTEQFMHTKDISYAEVALKNLDSALTNTYTLERKTKIFKGKNIFPKKNK